MIIVCRSYLKHRDIVSAVSDAESHHGGACCADHANHLTLLAGAHSSTNHARAEAAQIHELVFQAVLRHTLPSLVWCNDHKHSRRHAGTKRKFTASECEAVTATHVRQKAPDSVDPPFPRHVVLSTYTTFRNLGRGLRQPLYKHGCRHAPESFEFLFYDFVYFRKSTGTLRQESGNGMGSVILRTPPGQCCGRYWGFAHFSPNIPL